MRIGSKLARREFREEGQSLVEVLVALSVLVVVLVPALFLVTGSTRVVYNNEFQVTAANFANGQLEADRNQVAASGKIPATFSQQVVSSSYTVSAGGPNTYTVTPQSGEAYTVTQLTGWCSAPTSSPARSWGPDSLGAPYAYVALVTVTWKANSVGMQVAGVLTTPPGATLSGTCPR